MTNKKGLLERLAEGPVIGDGGFCFQLEKRGYVTAGAWTPEVTVEAPEAVRQLHREFLRAGSDVMQAFTFYATEDKLASRGNKAGEKIGVEAINRAAAQLAKEVAAEGEALTGGGVSQCPSYLTGTKEEVQAEFRKQVTVFVDEELDFLLCEYFEHVEEIEWAIQVCKETSKTVTATMCIGPEGDRHGVSAADCAVRMARAGADVVGVNCNFDPFICLETIRSMKAGLEAAGLHSIYLMVQPCGFMTPDANKRGYLQLPEFPFAMEPRLVTRWDMHKYAREAFSLGVRYIGGCCGIEPYHIRAVSEELQAERGGRLGASSDKHGLWGARLVMSLNAGLRARAQRAYWEQLRPASGRPYCSSMSKLDDWDKMVPQPNE